jgi:hypothetical protein
MNSSRRRVKGLAFDALWVENADDCWVWIGVRNQQDYAVYWDNTQNKYTAARRWAQSRALGRDLDPCERMRNQCGDAACVNPDHYRLTQFVPANPAWSNSAPRPQSRGPRPHVWATGPDPAEHARYRVWIQQRNQAHYRAEPWALDFEPWKQIWAPHWHLKGRTANSRCMTRVDTDLPWQPDNVRIITRSEHSAQQAAMRSTGYRSRAQQRRLDRSQT